MKYQSRETVEAQQITQSNYKKVLAWIKRKTKGVKVTYIIDDHDDNIHIIFHEKFRDVTYVVQWSDYVWFIGNHFTWTDEEDFLNRYEPVVTRYNERSR